MKICFISDTHDLHHKVTLPEADILVHAGDLTMAGEPEYCLKALAWLNAQPHEHVVLVAGNHDFAFESEHKDVLLKGFDRLIYLENSGAEVAGLKFWGSPVQPWFHDWAFNVQRGEAISKIWNQIPEGLDVLITHGPPFSILDQAVKGRSEHLGCGDLLARLCDVKPKIHVFGHIHGSYGRRDAVNTKYFNASVVNEAYQVVNEPQVIEL
jgi:Icc-related predicted phosphoesterase